MSYQLAIFTGLRPGELWALRWCDVQFGVRPALRVRRAVKPDGTIGPPKSGKCRTVPLLEQAQAALRALHPGAPDDLVLPAPGGSHRETGEDLGWADRRRGRQPLQVGHRSLAGLPDHVDFYAATRHTCATALLHGWWGRRWSITEVRDFLGHSSIVVTQRYAHGDEDSLHAAAAATRADEGGSKTTPVASSTGAVSSKPSAALVRDLADKSGVQHRRQGVAHPDRTDVIVLPPHPSAIVSTPVVVADSQPCRAAHDLPMGLAHRRGPSGLLSHWSWVRIPPSPPMGDEICSASAGERACSALRLIGSANFSDRVTRPR